MKTYFTIAASLLVLFVTAQQATLTPGKTAPGIQLMNVTDKTVSLNNYAEAKGFIIVFTCNTCPYAKAYEQRIIALNNKYAPLGFPVIAINPNDPAVSPGDSFEKMKALAKSHDYSFPYLFDEGQVVTTQYGAKNTPHVFVAGKTNNNLIIEYVGAIDNDTQDANTTKIKYVEDAVNALLQNNKPTVSSTKAIGCSVKWKRAD
jgi:peroxiredoxin